MRGHGCSIIWMVRPGPSLGFEIHRRLPPQVLGEKLHRHRVGRRFLEPLESTSIHLVQTGISKLMVLFPDRGFSATEIDAYNGYALQEYERVRDFLILHYKATLRDDTPFWRRCRHMSIPDSLQQKIDLFSAKGRSLPTPDDLFTEHSWIAVMLGQGIEPQGYDPLVDSQPIEQVRRFVQHAGDVVSKTALAMPLHEAFIDQHCRSRCLAASATA